MRLSLLRAPKAPDANADIGRHTFRYAMFPHAGPLGPATVFSASDFNNPLAVLHAPHEGVQRMQSPIRALTLGHGSSIVLDCLKRGEDDEDVSLGDLPVRPGRSIIMRLYESLGGQSSTTVKVIIPLKKVYKVNLLEDDLEEVPFDTVDVNGEKSQIITLTLRAFEVATYRLQLGK